MQAIAPVTKEIQQARVDPGAQHEVDDVEQDRVAREEGDRRTVPRTERVAVGRDRLVAQPVPALPDRGPAVRLLGGVAEGGPHHGPGDHHHRNAGEQPRLDPVGFEPADAETGEVGVRGLAHIVRQLGERAVRGLGCLGPLSVAGRGVLVLRLENSNVGIHGRDFMLYRYLNENAQVKGVPRMAAGHVRRPDQRRDAVVGVAGRGLRVRARGFRGPRLGGRARPARAYGPRLAQRSTPPRRRADARGNRSSMALAPASVIRTRRGAAVGGARGAGDEAAPLQLGESLAHPGPGHAQALGDAAGDHRLGGVPEGNEHVQLGGGQQRALVQRLDRSLQHPASARSSRPAKLHRRRVEAGVVRGPLVADLRG